jgi:uncharacterized RmlC-like cupin family protein
MTRILCAIALASCWHLSASAQQHDHRMVMPAELKWSAVPSLPPGAGISVIEGPITEAVPYTFRVKLPANYRIPPHWHAVVERLTVISGTFHVGMGERFEQAKTRALPAGGMMVMQPKTPHYAWTKEETVVQLHGTGPWGLAYVNPADDPRKQ